MKQLSSLLRPQTLNEVYGQTHIKEFLKKLVENREMISLLLYGPPGIGKTSLAYALCNDFKVTYSYFNAATQTKKELIAMIEMNDYIIIDEIHRLNKDKQDLLLPAIEKENVKVIATTTENPYFVVNPAVRSRMHILELQTMSNKELIEALSNVVKKEKLKIKITKKMLNIIAENSNGDYRYSLNIIALLSKLYANKTIDEKILKVIMPSMHFYSDRNGDGHYDLLSAFHKSLRGSDENAALYYLAQLIKSGDLLGMERRMIMVAYEDVGLGNPNIALRVTTALDNAKKIGFPEARIILASAIIDICKAPKSNSAYLAIANTFSELEKTVHPVPDHLKDAHYKSASKLGRGISYKYPHDYGGWIKQQYLPDKIKNKKFYVKNKNDKI